MVGGLWFDAGLRELAHGLAKERVLFQVRTWT
jgi:hypothetical protein